MNARHLLRMIAVIAAPMLVDGVGCRTPTAMTVHVTSDVPCSAQKGVTVIAASPDEYETAPASSRSTHCTALGGGLYDMGTLVVSPHADGEDRIGIRAVLGVARDPESCSADQAFKGCIVARRLLHYLPHDELTVEIVLRQECQDVACGPDSTCVDRVCHGAEVDPSACTGSCDQTALADRCTPPGKVECTAGKRSTCQSDGSRKVEDCGISCSATTCVGASQVVAVGATSDTGGTSCALVSGEVRCWGSNSVQRAGADAATSSLAAPTKVSGLPEIVQIAAAGTAEHVVARDATGAIWCWGLAERGQCGAPEVSSTGPRLIVDGTMAVVRDVAQVVTGSVTTCYRTNAGAVFCMGENGKGVLGPGTTADHSAAPVPLPATGWSGRAVDLACSTNTCCLLDDAGQVACWGNDDSGQVGDGTTAPLRSAPTHVPLDPRAKSLHAGDQTFCAVLQDGGVACWGANYRNVYIDPMANQPSPLRLHALDGKNVAWLSIGMPRGHYARLSTGEVLGWGTDGLNVGAIALVPSLQGASAISIAAQQGCAIVAGTIECWGTNGTGELGDGSSGHPDPQPVPWK